LKGLNWFGFDTEKLGLHGLWSGRPLKSFLDQIVSLGFNALRIPLSPQALDKTQKGSDGYDTPVAQLEDLMTKADTLGIHIVFDFHNCHYSVGHTQGRPDPDLAECPGYDLNAWLEDLGALAKLAKAHKSVVGIDLFNEPYDLSWAQWRENVNLGARRVLDENPRILVFVQGVGGSADQAGGYPAFWGENFVQALSDPVAVPKSRLVFSPHVYGPSVFEQDYFSEASFPSNLDDIWDTHFGFLREKNYPLAIGEFGGKYSKFEDGRDVQWQNRFVSYLTDRSIEHFFYWSLNPNSGDTNGILEDDWLTVDQDKLQLLKPLLDVD
jgi:endoglucanase